MTQVEMEQDVFMDIILKRIKEKFKSHLLRKERNIMHNMVYLIGRITKDVEVRETGNDKQIAIVNIACQRNYKNEEGEYETDFFPVVLWNAIANNVCEYCSKGDLVGIKGHLQQASYEVDGEYRSKTEIIADKVSFLASKRED